MLEFNRSGRTPFDAPVKRRAANMGGEAYRQ
jgi:hypothetical protein